MAVCVFVCVMSMIDVFMEVYMYMRVYDMCISTLITFSLQLYIFHSILFFFDLLAWGLGGLFSEI